MTDEGGKRWGRFWVIAPGAVAGAVVATKFSLTEKGLVILSASRVKPPEPPAGGGDTGVSGGPGGAGQNMFDDVSRFVSEHAADVVLGATLGAVIAAIAFSALSQNRQQAYA